jgi:hypothetical protein
MTEREQTENEILAQCIREDSTGEINRGEERVRHAEGQERSVRRAMWLMVLLTVMAVIALGYSVILLYELPPYQTEIVNHVIVVVGFASLISLLAFAGFWILCRQRLAARREEGRQVVLRHLARRSGTRPPKHPEPPSAANE